MIENLDNNLPFSIVEGYKNLIRDEKTKAILNTNYNEYDNYKKMKKIKDEEISRINNLEDDLKNIKDDIDEIKFLLRNIANGSK
jgi:esterase/lipase